MTDLRATLPKVDALLDPVWVDRFGHARVVRHARQIIDQARAEAAEGRACELPSLLNAMVIHLNDGLQPVINGTVSCSIQTSVGPHGAKPRKTKHLMQWATVPLSLISPQELGGSEVTPVEDRICALTGAEAALVVNNCAGAVLLMLAALASGKTVLVSRGELVEIGGGFRVPDVMAASGALLKEVGTTNRTHARDFEMAISDDVAGVLKVHHSNFKQVGFVSQPTLSALGQLSAPLWVDLGSGQLDFHKNEPSVIEAMKAGADVICMSGDKLLGGPQAGVIIGKSVRLASSAVIRCTVRYDQIKSYWQP